MTDLHNVQRSVFLSYRRRVGWQSARLVYSSLSAHAYDVFMDVESLGSGAFPAIIEHQIEARPHFIVILNPRALANIQKESDWLRREIAHAVKCKRNIVPLLFDGFSFDEEVGVTAAELDEIRTLSQQNGVVVPIEYFDAAMERLRTHFLTRTGGIATPTPPDEEIPVGSMIENAKRADEASGALPPNVISASGAYNHFFVQKEDGDDSFFVVPIFYATDRHRRSLSWKPDDRFAGHRSQGGNLWLGRSSVSLPPAHRLNVVERPSWLRLAFREDSSKHVVIQNLSELSLTEFRSSVRDHIEQCQPKEALVYLHGYNVTFGQAVRRTAQIAFDLKFEGAAVAYSWPSQGSLTGYSQDEANVDWSVPHLEAFLRQLKRGMGLEKIHIIAHNMGSRALLRALITIDNGTDVPSEATVRQVIFVAPDIDADIFRQLAPKLTGAAERVTLYAASGDPSLTASRSFHRYPRAGQSEPEPIVVPGVDTILASSFGTVVGNSYFAERQTIIPDLYYLLRTGSAPSERPGLFPSLKEQLVYWTLRA
jgi:esterase/lipase superfamily enzyme